MIVYNSLIEIEFFDAYKEKFTTEKSIEFKYPLIQIVTESDK